MKLRVLIASLAVIWSTAHSQSVSTAIWDTTEYNRSRTLNVINADIAYSRGYTGKGSIIAILDSGIDTKNVDFQNGKILKTQDFTSSGSIADTIGHGTHVAGIAAAADNGLGIEGVAFNASLLIGKITTTGIVLSTTMLQGVQWASANNADVINLSSNFTLSQQALQAKLISPGVYSTVYTNTGTLPGGVNASQWASALGTNTVLVVAAGNDSTAWNGGITQIATATDSTGKLILGGRVIIAGNWNEQTNTGLGPSSNGAATLCQTVVGGVCQDKYQAWQFYLLAPGTSITSTVPTSINSTGLASMTGTSMAAPVISGAVAIIHQEWPQMTGSNIASLLLLTANKNIPNYNQYVDGQGLLDLDKATRPVGTLGIPTTGRLTGPSVTSIQPILLTGGSASTAKVSSLMVVDSFQRDFYVNSKSMTGYQVPHTEFNVKQAAMPYATGNTYALFNNYTDYITVKTGESTMTMYVENNPVMPKNSPVMVEFSKVKKTDFADFKFNWGVLAENNSWLGNSVSSFINVNSTNNASVTQFMGAGVEHNLDAKHKVYGNFMNGVTLTKAASDNISNIGPVFSYSWSLGIEQKLSEQSSIGVMTYQPVSVYYAKANITAPVGLDSNFNVIQNSTANLSADVHERRTGLYFKMNDKKSVNLIGFLEYRNNYQGVEGASDTVVGAVLTKRF